MLNDIGIIGWGDIEATILSALVARHPLLLVGSHGSNKTDGARLLSYATLGRSARFQAYDTRLIHQDDLMGFANPASLKEGVVTYAHTEISIWGAKSVLLDEFNRTNPFIASKMMEIVRTKKVQGQQLDLELVFASANPPGGQYDTVFLDPAVASRFSIVRVPDFLSPSDLDAVLALPDNWVDQIPDSSLTAFQAVVEKAREEVFSSEELLRTQNAVRTLVLSLRSEPNPPVYVSARQARVMVRLLLACEALKKVTSLRFTDKDRASLLLSLLPETSGMCRTTVSASGLRPFISRVLSGFRLGDPLVTSSSLSDLLDRRISDQPVWVATVKSRVQSCTDPSELHSFLQRLSSTPGLNSDTLSSICSAGVERYLSLASEEGDASLVPITWDRTNLVTYVRSLFAKDAATPICSTDELLEP